MHRYKELEVWKKAVGLATDIYQMTDRFPDTEKYGLTSQMRRSAVSISSNIAEGAGRDHQKDFSRFLSIALGSFFELETQLIVSNQVGITKEAELNPIQEEVTYLGNMLYKLKKTLVQN